jgi:hypothetical protein
MDEIKLDEISLQNLRKDFVDDVSRAQVWEEHALSHLRPHHDLLIPLLTDYNKWPEARERLGSAQFDLMLKMMVLLVIARINHSVADLHLANLDASIETWRDRQAKIDSEFNRPQAPEKSPDETPAQTPKKTKGSTQ